MTKPTATLVASIREEYALNEKGMASLDFVINVYPALADRLEELEALRNDLAVWWGKEYREDPQVMPRELYNRLHGLQPKAEVKVG